MLLRAFRDVRHLLRRIRDWGYALTGSRSVRIDFPSGTVAFRVRNAIERHRVKEFGGEKAVLDRFLEEVACDDIVYDIGASLGLYSTAAATVARGGSVIAFEPDPDTRRRLEETVERNALANVVVVPWAVSDREGETTLYTEGASGLAPSMHRQKRRGAPRESVRVPMRTLDDAVASGELPSPTVMKIDVEGAEGLCLAGARRILGGEVGAAPRAILIELHPDYLEAYGSSVESVSAMLSASGYEPVYESRREAQVHVLYRHCSRDS